MISALAYLVLSSTAAPTVYQTGIPNPEWWGPMKNVGKSSDDVWPSLKSYSPNAMKGEITMTVGDVGVLYFTGPSSTIEVANAIRLIDHRFIRRGSETTPTPGKPLWLNPMSFLANSDETVGEETVHSELTAAQFVAMATGSTKPSNSVRFFMPSYLADVDGQTIEGQVELENSPLGQMLFLLVPMKNGLSAGAVVVSPNESLYRVITRFLPSSLTTRVAAIRQKFDWRKWFVSSVVVAPNEVFAEKFPRRVDDGAFRQDLNDLGVFSFRKDAHITPVADPSMPFTSTEFRPTDWVR